MTRSVHLRRTLPACLAAVTAAAVAGGVLVLAPTDASAAPGGKGNPHTRNVIFINGDGMSAAHREAARLAQVGYDGDLVMNTLGATGLQTTDPDDVNDTITDSAAAASAWATGVKTYNGAISVANAPVGGKDAPGRALLTLGKEAKDAGKATGIVTTAQVTDASPAAFFSNTANRSNQDDIARQYLEVTRPDVILGGGEDWWLPAGTPGAFPDNPPEDPAEASRGTKGDLVGRAKQLGYTYVTSRSQLQRATGDKLLGLFANEEMFQQRPEGAGDVYTPVVPLPEMTRKALDIVSRDKDGFFLLVEEEGVDEFAHDDNGARMLQSMKYLEDTVRLARDYVQAHPDTLLVVTGDHDCGGLSIEGPDTGDENGAPGISGEDGPFTIPGDSRTFVMDWTTAGHTGVPTVVTGAGYGSEQLVGYYPNTHLHEVMHRVLFGR
ncbi:alkaline phosphatase [Blastococcus sp. TF02-8]|uniref:alkaline phosphatase n=1 Tax=Blastococcus sp. TF02-8 TaxID=2250574 RepID=UPI000DEAC348|nr:alkaline phosphatase [Blastococcus sp. TF02-8]RBY93418.1 alkaline phosphatase [Blastococcus sp. TF02-8]